jgi:hypothetical protein
MAERVRLRAEVELDIAEGREVEQTCQVISAALESLRRPGDGTPRPTVVVTDRSRPTPRARRWNNTYVSRHDEVEED